MLTQQGLLGRFIGDTDVRKLGFDRPFNAPQRSF